MYVFEVYPYCSMHQCFICLPLPGSFYQQDCVFSLYPFMWPGERLSPHVSFSLRLLTAAVYQTPAWAHTTSRSPLCICHPHVTHEDTQVSFFISLSVYVCVCVYLKIYLFTFGYAGSSLLRGLSLVWQVGLLFVAVCGFTVMASLAERRL